MSTESCELCASTGELSRHGVAPRGANDPDGSVRICAACASALADPAANAQHWYCLRESMWSERSAVKVLAYRTLKKLEAHPLGQELLGQLYLEPEDQQWADAAGGDEEPEDEAPRDSNGTVLQEGDTVTLIKDLDVKGAGFTAKRGTTVKGINLTGDPKYVEGKVNGIRIVLVAAYLKKA